jgi:hypothetical protein
MSKDKDQHDVKDTTNKRTGGEVPHPPKPSNIEQGTKPSEVRDEADRADAPKP